MLSLERFTLAYKEQVIFQNANFKAVKGTITLLVGKSGLGKTTLLDIIAGLKIWKFGTYHYGNKQLSFYDDEEMSHFRSKHISYVPQDFALIDDYTVLENLYLPFHYQSSTLPISIANRMGDWLRRFELEHIQKKKVKDISGGQKQRVAIIRSLLLDFPIFLADEPTANLDDENFQLIQDILLEQKAAGKMVIVASHDSRLLPIADKIYKVADYQLIEE